MQFTITTLITALLASTAIAAPAPAFGTDAELSKRELEVLEKRQTANGFTRGGCKRVIMVYARGSTEMGNVGMLGPSLESGLEREYRNNFALQGVEYPADIASNMLPKGTNDAAIRTMAGLFNEIDRRCPETVIAAGGYSQGSAVAVGALQEVSPQVKDKVKATVLFGYTKNLQNRERIPNYPQDRTLIICNVGDLVCSGMLVIMPAHLTYTADVSKAVRFIAQKIGRI